ncbi:MAG: glycosyltransferase [Fimbriimonadales bacterium]
MEFNVRKIAYVVKRYPRFSETFIVNEILEHERAGVPIEIFSIRPPIDTHFQDVIGRVRAPVTYINSASIRAFELWDTMRTCAGFSPAIWEHLSQCNETALDVYQGSELARLCHVRGITHIHAHFASAATTVARLASKFTGIPYTFTAHAKDIFHETVDPEDLSRKIADASAVVTVSDFNLDHLNETFGKTAINVKRIYNGIDLDRFPYSAPEDRAPTIVSVGRLVEKKGLSDLVDACSILKGRGVDFSCRIVGTGELEQPLREQILSLNLGDWVSLDGPRPQGEVAELVQSASVLAAPCVVGRDGNRDGLPTVLLEAMALGTPCVSTDVTGIPEVVRHGETGSIVGQHRPQELADSLADLLARPKLRMDLAAAARRLIEEEFDIVKNTVKQRDLFAAAPVSAGAIT